MATTVTNLTPLGMPFPYIGIGVPAAQYITPIPSAEFIFLSQDAITVAAAGEAQQLNIICTLPRSFCYALVESVLQIRGADSADWQQACTCTTTDGDSILPVDYSNVGGVSILGQTNFIKTYVARDIPNRLLVPRTVADGALELDVFNSTVDGAVGSLFFFARFLRFDRNQSQHWQVNTPVLTR